MTGTTAFVPTDDQRTLVTVMRACGFPDWAIAKQIKWSMKGRGETISLSALLKHFPRELDSADAMTSGMVAKSLFQKAIGNGPQSTTAAMFWLRTRGGQRWQEKMALTGPNGGPIQLEVSHREQLRSAILASAKTATEEGDPQSS